MHYDFILISHVNNEDLAKILFLGFFSWLTSRTLHISLGSKSIGGYTFHNFLSALYQDACTVISSMQVCNSWKDSKEDVKLLDCKKFNILATCIDGSGYF